MHPFNIAQAADTTASFSIGFSEQVEYVIIPDSFSKNNPWSKRASCRGWHFKEVFVVQVLSISSGDIYNKLGIRKFFLTVPSPLHGTSQSTLSKLIFLCKSNALLLVTITKFARSLII